MTIDIKVFESEIHRFCDLTKTRLATHAVEALFEELKSSHPSDFREAISRMAASGSKMTLALLKKNIYEKKMARIERENFEKEQRDKGEGGNYHCQEICSSCGKIDRCRIRGREWLVSISSILSEGDARKKAEQLIHFMKKEFRGQAGGQGN